MKKIISLISVFSILLLSAFASTALAAETKTSYIDNSSLIPAIVSDDKVKLDEAGTPDWASSLIFGTANLSKSTEEGTLEAAVKVLDHYAEMGINGLWVLPVYDPGTAEYPNGYVNLGPHTINPKLTGTTDYEKGWKKMAWFVKEAHKRNIRVILDIITWGASDESKLLTEKPHFFSSEGPEGYYYNWDNDDFVEWYIKNAVDIVLKTGCDGLRYDTEPSYAGYDVAIEIRERLWKAGRKPFMMSERENERGQAYDVGQCGMTEGVSYETYKSVDPIYFWLDKYNIVDSIKNGEHFGTQASQDLADGGTYHYYTFCVTNHDYSHTVVNGNRAAVGYQAIFTPFIPVILLGEEFNNPQRNDNPLNPALYFNRIDWNCLKVPENRALFEDIKKMIRIRRTYTDIFEYYPEQFKDSNICKVNVKACEVAQPYARYSGDTAMLVVPNYNLHEKNTKMTVYIPFAGTGLDYYRHYKVTDVETGEVIVTGTASEVAKFTVKVPHSDQRVFMVKASGKIDPSELTDEEKKDWEQLESNDNTGEDSQVSEDPTDLQSSEIEAPTDALPSETDTSAEEPTTDTDATETTTETVVVKKKKKKKNPENNFPMIPVIIGSAASVIAIVGGATVVFIRKKRK